MALKKSGEVVAGKRWPRGGGQGESKFTNSDTLDSNLSIDIIQGNLDCKAIRYWQQIEY